MSRPIYSTNFVSAVGLVGALTVPNPGPNVYVLRDMDVYATGVLSAPFTVVWLHGVNGQAIWYRQWQPGAQEWDGWRGRQVIEPGTSFDVRADNGPVDVTVSGYVLTAP